MNESDFGTLIPRPIDDRRWLAEICRFRARVWQMSGSIAENAFPGGEWRDTDDAHAAHWIVLDEVGRLVGAASLRVHPSIGQVREAFQYERYGIQTAGRVAAPNHVVVCPTARRRGIAMSLLQVQEEAAIAQGASLAVRQASPAMVRLVASRGWQVAGPALSDPRFPDVPFTVVTKNLLAEATATPNSLELASAAS